MLNSPKATLDFSDLQLKTRDLLRDKEEIRQKLVDRYKFYMVDEFQDTNKLQYDLVMRLTNKLESANLFIVGDPKQSIYAFRGADVRVFKKMHEKKSLKTSGLTISLKENFRSLHDIIKFTNHFFGHLMGDRSENEFEVPYESAYQSAQHCHRRNRHIKILLGSKERRGKRKRIRAHRTPYQKNKTKRKYGMDTRARIAAEVERPIAYGDIAILIRSRRHIPRP